MPDFHVAFRNLLHAVNLRHGTDGFTSPPKEGVLRNFFALKNPTVSAGFEPANLGTKGQHATSRPPKPLSRTHNFIFLGHRIASQVSWYSLGPNYFLWGYLKPKAHGNNPRTIGQLKEQIGDTIRAPDESQREIKVNFLSRLQKCIACQREKLQEAVFKKHVLDWILLFIPKYFLCFSYSNQFNKTTNWKSSQSIGPPCIVYVYSFKGLSLQKLSLYRLPWALSKVCVSFI